MHMKLNITRILSLSVLLLLPAFAAAGQRKAVKKAALPRLVSDGAAFRAFSKPAAGAGSTTTEDGGEVSGAEVNGAQSTSGAGVSVGVPIGTGLKATGSSSPGVSASGGSVSGSAGFSTPAWKVPAGCAITPVTWPPGLSAYQGGTPTQRTAVGGMAAYQMLPYQPQSQPNGRIAGLAYGCSTEFSVSVNPCEWGDPLVAKGCQRSGVDVMLYYGQDSCALEFGRVYYLNVRPLGRQSSAWSDCKYYLSHYLENSTFYSHGNSPAAISPSEKCLPPPAMTTGEKIDWLCSMAENQGPNCRTRATTLLPYISDYAKYPGLDTRGCPSAPSAGQQCNALMCSGGSLQLTSYNVSPKPPACAGKRAGQACSSGEGCMLSQPTACN